MVKSYACLFIECVGRRPDRGVWTLWQVSRVSESSWKVSSRVCSNYFSYLCHGKTGTNVEIYNIRFFPMRQGPCVHRSNSRLYSSLSYCQCIFLPYWHKKISWAQYLCGLILVSCYTICIIVFWAIIFILPWPLCQYRLSLFLKIRNLVVSLLDSYHHGGTWRLESNALSSLH